MIRFPVRRRRVLPWRQDLLVLGSSPPPSPSRDKSQFEVYPFAVDSPAARRCSIFQASVIWTIREDAGPSSIVSVRRLGSPLKVRSPSRQRPRTGDALVHYRTECGKFFAGLPPGIPVSLIATAPYPRWRFGRRRTVRDLRERCDLVTTDEGLGRFSDSLIEYAARLDDSSARGNWSSKSNRIRCPRLHRHDHQDGSDVRCDADVK